MAAVNFINLGYEWFTRKGNLRRPMLMENEMALKDTYSHCDRHEADSGIP